MKKSLYLFGLLFTASIIFTACGEDKPPPCLITDVGVVIDGTRWATRNADINRTFAPHPQSPGASFQWNRCQGWSATIPCVGIGIPIEGWNNTPAEGTAWYAENDPCPAGWRVPTEAELHSLNNAGSTWTMRNGVNGRVFGTAPHQVFLPAAGFRISTVGTLVNVGVSGGYLSSTQIRSTGVIGLHFHTDSSSMFDWYRVSGLSVRCVAK